MLERLAYLNAGTFGPLARPTAEAIAARQQGDLDEGRGGMPYFEAMIALRGRVREGLARTIGAPAERIALTSSTTEGCNIVLAGHSGAGGILSQQIRTMRSPVSEVWGFDTMYGQGSRLVEAKGFPHDKGSS